MSCRSSATHPQVGLHQTGVGRHAYQRQPSRPRRSPMTSAGASASASMLRDRPFDYRPRCRYRSETVRDVSGKNAVVRWLRRERLHTQCQRGNHLRRPNVRRRSSPAPIRTLQRSEDPPAQAIPRSPYCASLGRSPLKIRRLPFNPSAVLGWRAVMPIAQVTFMSDAEASSGGQGRGQRFQHTAHGQHR